MPEVVLSHYLISFSCWLCGSYVFISIFRLENHGSKHVDLSKDYLASKYDSMIWSFSTKRICLSIEVAVFMHLSDGNKMV